MSVTDIDSGWPPRRNKDLIQHRGQFSFRDDEPLE